MNSTPYPKDTSSDPINASDGILKDPHNDPGIGYVGSMLMLNLISGNTFMVHAEDIVGIEENTPSRCLKLFIRDKTSPVLVSSDLMELGSVISKLRDRENK